ncbi:MAG TPA: TonB-dependent receptor [Prolixibacteraceae bacterium]|nr:TonB-dependent receptor [Prolixibacteraceae bacterium]
MKIFRTILLTVALFASFFDLSGQITNATLYGVVTGDNGEPVDMVNVSLRNYPFGTTTNPDGEYLLRIPSGRDVVVVFSSIGFESVEETLHTESEASIEMNVQLKQRSEEIDEIVIARQRQTSGNIVRINPRTTTVMADVGLGSVEGIIKTLPGVNASNELSSQYSVRGGNFDENLVYVNDIEVYRPYLIRSGQQEGLSFVNSDMVSSIEFSAGGFDAQYGDKMSSVLDIQYNRPSRFSASADVSLLGAKAHIENISRDQRFTYNMGVRYKTFGYLLGTLEDKGEYTPTFLDYQGYFTYALSKKWDVGFLGTASYNRYQFIPESRKSKSGIFNDQKSLHIEYEGQEIDRYETYTGAFFLDYNPAKNVQLRLIASAYTTAEAETYDIVGYYWFNEVGNEGTEEQTDSVMNLGVGFYHEHGRNFLEATVAGLEHRGSAKLGGHFLRWGIQGKNELVSDRMKEWVYRDSAGYSLPYSYTSDSLYYLARTNYGHQEQRYTAFLQDTWSIPTGIGNFLFNAGIRSHYWTYTRLLTVSPRFSASLQTGLKNNIIARMSFGWYHQPPFYREIKDLYGTINPNIQTPRSVHLVGGVDYSFSAWGRPFRLTADAYYKWLNDLIPYQYENVRVRYLSNLISDGYAYGFDVKVNGEFVSGTQSWISASLMDTREDIAGDGHGFIPRPSDQRFKFSMFFQDYLPGLPAYQMHLTGHFITGMPFGMPRSPRFTQTARIESYKRVDIGFMRSLVSNGKNLTNWAFLDKFRECSITIEVFNILDTKNVSSYTFIADYDKNYHAIPNRLTGRLFNLKISAGF